MPEWELLTVRELDSIKVGRAVRVPEELPLRSRAEMAGRCHS
jgi:hypothetical protein